MDESLPQGSDGRSRGRGALALLALVLGAVSLTVADVQPPWVLPYRPERLQGGKDVIWLPTSQRMVGMMLDLAEVTARDRVIDLGSGDGRVVIAAARRGARAHGIEYNTRLVELSRFRARLLGLADRATFAAADLFEADLSPATVVSMFLLPSINIDLRPRLLGLLPGTRVVSNTFDMGDWEPDDRMRLDDCENWCSALLWVVPARAGGVWDTPEGPLALDQEFQFVSGALGEAVVANGRLRGPVLSFTADGRRYTGHVSGETMTVVADAPDGRSWTARLRRPGRIRDVT